MTKSQNGTGTIAGSHGHGTGVGFGARLVEIWADLTHAQGRIAEINRPWLTAGTRRNTSR